MNWRKLARCRDANQDMFSPRTKTIIQKLNLTVRRCDDCIVKALCLQDCVDVYITDRRNRAEWAEQFGYRAGMTGPERQQYVKEAIAALTPTEAQEEAIQSIMDERSHAALVASETGAGKTLLAVEALKRLDVNTVLVIIPLNID